MWIFTTSPNGQLSLALEMFGNAVILRGTSSRGFRDFATASHFSAYEEYFSVYRWNGTKYGQIDCYKVTSDSDNSTPPSNCGLSAVKGGGFAHKNNPSVKQPLGYKS
jgi:hypothetical protein